MRKAALDLLITDALELLVVALIPPKYGIDQAGGPAFVQRPGCLHGLGDGCVWRDARESQLKQPYEQQGRNITITLLDGLVQQGTKIVGQPGLPPEGAKTQGLEKPVVHGFQPA